MEQIEAALRSGKTMTDLLTDPALLPAHEWPQFRELIRRAGTSWQATIVTAQEPGVPMLVSGRVVDKEGQPVKRAMVYAYQTSAKGWYSERAPHFAGQEGDRRHARLFGYLTTDNTGRFEIKTIRPGGYSDADLPAHIHIEVGRGEERSTELTTEIQFDDDPRLTTAWRTRSRQEGFVIAKVNQGADNVQRVQVEIKLR
jgi:protocatechuate 3,4-dioxygenase beta subunit